MEDEKAKAAEQEAEKAHTIVLKRAKEAKILKANSPKKLPVVKLKPSTTEVPNFANQNKDQIQNTEDFDDVLKSAASMLTAIIKETEVCLKNVKTRANQGDGEGVSKTETAPGNPMTGGKTKHNGFDLSEPSGV